MTNKPFIHTLLTLILLVIVLGFYFVWYAIVSNASTKARTLASELELKSKEVAELISTKAALTTIAANEEDIETHLVSSDTVVSFLETLESTAKSHGAELEIVSVLEEIQTPRSHLKLALRITGTFTAVVRTLGIIEYGQHDIVTESLILDTPMGVTSDSMWTAVGIFFVGLTTKSPVASSTIETP